MCSGVGPENVLKETGIPMELINEHVGRNLADVSIFDVLTHSRCLVFLAFALEVADVGCLPYF